MSYIEKFWRDATVSDLVKVMESETVEARFSDVPNGVQSKVTQLVGAKRLSDNGTVWLSPNTNWRYCQVYDPPQWYLEKPDPGDKYRLLGKFPDEALQPGDEVFDLRGDGKWEPSFNVEIKQPQGEGIWYRRKIEQPKPEPKHYVLRVGDTVETPSGHLIKIIDRPTEQMHYKLQVGDSVEFPDGWTVTAMGKGIFIK